MGPLRNPLGGEPPSGRDSAREDRRTPCLTRPRSPLSTVRFPVPRGEGETVLPAWGGQLIRAGSSLAELLSLSGCAVLSAAHEADDDPDDGADQHGVFPFATGCRLAAGLTSRTVRGRGGGCRHPPR